MYSQIDSNKRRTTALIVLFIAIIVFIGWVFSDVLGYGYGAMIFAFIISIGMTLMSYYTGDKIALLSTGAKQIQKEQNPYVYRMVENLSITAGLPMPKVYIVESPQSNAFATGRDPQHAAIAVTTGILQLLTKNELKGVLAHEMGHVANFDIRFATLVAVMVGMVSIIAEIFLRSLWFSGNRDREGKGKAILLVVGIILAIVAPIVVQLVQLAISRKRI